MYKRGTETSKVLEDLMNVINWSCKIKVKKDLLDDPFLTDDDKSFADYVIQQNGGNLNIFWQSLMKGYDEIKISPHPHTTLEMILLRCAFLVNDNSSEVPEEKKKPEITPEKIEPSPNLDRAIENSVQEVKKPTLSDRIKIHQDFFNFYGKNFSPLMAGIILENCEISEFSENNKKLVILAKEKNFSGSEELLQNLQKDFEIQIRTQDTIEPVEKIKSLYKQEIINQEMQSDDFKKVLAKFPNAKIIDVEEIERGDKQ